jgi:hypothetical protein
MATRLVGGLPSASKAFRPRPFWPIRSSLPYRSALFFGLHIYSSAGLQIGQKIFLFFDNKKVRIKRTHKY